MTTPPPLSQALADEIIRLRRCVRRPIEADIVLGRLAQSADPEMAPGRADLATLLTRTLGMLQPIEEAA